MKKWFASIEGLDGSGKSTVAKLLAEQMGAVLYKCPPDPFRQFRKTVDEQVGDPVVKFFFYLAGNFQAANEIRRMLEEHPVVCDRYIDSTLAFHRAQGVQTDILVGDLGKILLMPDLRFFVACSRAVRITRMGGRGAMSFNDKLGLRIALRYIKEYKRLNPVMIDNSTKDPQVAVDAMIAQIRLLK